MNPNGADIFKACLTSLAFGLVPKLNTPGKIGPPFSDENVCLFNNSYNEI